MHNIKKFFNVDNYVWLLVSLVLASGFFLYAYLKLHKYNLISFIGIGKIKLMLLLGILIFLGALIYFFKKKVSTMVILKKFFWSFLPLEIILSYLYLFNKIGYDKSIFSYTCRPFIGLYLIFLGFFFLFKYKKYGKLGDFLREFSAKEVKGKSLSILNRIWPSVIIFIVMAVNLGFGSYHLAQFAAVDEPLWIYNRIPKFWTNVMDGEFNKTMVSDKPGITVAIISGAALNFLNPDYYTQAKWDGDELGNFIGVEKLNFSLRFPILFFNCLMLLVFYYFLKKLLGRTTAVISVIFIGLSPLLLGISGIVNPDSLLWTFAPLALIAYLTYLKEQRNKFLYWAGIFLGLAVLTKYVSNILYVFFFGLIFLEYIINREKYENAAKYFKKHFADYLVLIFISLVTFFIFLPAAWMDIGRVMEGTILSKAFLKFWPAFLILIGLVMADIFLLKNRVIIALVNWISKYKAIILSGMAIIFSLLIIFTLLNTYTGMKYYNLEAILASPKSSKDFSGLLAMILANFYSLIFGLIPLAFLSMFYFSFSNIFSKKIDKESAVSFFYFSLFILLYYLASVLEGVSATVRYQIIIYPVAMILSALGLYQFLSMEKIKKILPKYFVYGIILIVALFSLNSIRPFYFSYASDFLPKQYVLNFKDMGDGSFEAAAYLNKLPNPKDLMIWTDKRGVCVFFQGTCKSGFNFDEAVKFDYFVVSSGRESRTSKMTAGRAAVGDPISIALNRIYEEKFYEYKLEIGGRPNNFVKIVPGEKVFGNNN